VDDIVANQIASGIDVVNDGEMSKTSYTMYVGRRASGIELSEEASVRGRETMITRDQLEYPDAFARLNMSKIPFLGCVGPVKYKDRGPLDRDIAHLTAALRGHNATEAFMTAPSPGILARFIIDLYYNNYEQYLVALAEMMKVEYEAIVEAGFLLQIDAPDLAANRADLFRDQTDSDFRRVAELHVAILNAATANIPPDRMRMHLCWGNYPGPHTHDIPLAQIIDIALKARPQALCFEASNPRHAHEWEDLKGVAIPSDKVLIPGVVDSTTNFVEHPKLIAQRLGHFVDLVGQDRVMAGSDCGFGTVAALPSVAPSVVWGKFRAMAEGARLATARAAA
jgi:5-methyltetrahydropteroyltriglutamate--homocysteine methyltransferase